DQIAVLDHGKIIALGTADELKDKVGKERLEVIVSAEADFSKAKEVAGESLAFAKDEDRVISLTTGGSVKDIKRILDLFDEAGVELESFTLHKPTLDDVFLELTGSDTTK